MFKGTCQYRKHEALKFYIFLLTIESLRDSTILVRIAWDIPLRLMGRCIVVCVCVVLASPVTSDARHLTVHSPFGPEHGEFKFGYVMDAFVDTDNALSGNLDRDGLLRHSIEVEYGITDKWQISYYADFEHQTQDETRFRYVQSRVESIYRLWDQDDLPFDAGLYFEYAVARSSYSEHGELEMKILLEKSVQEMLARFNPIFEHGINSDDGFELGYEAGWYYAGLLDGAWVGLETFGSFWLIRSFERLRDQAFSIGPATIFDIGAFEVDMGFQFGLTDDSDDVVFKSGVAFKF